MVWYNHLAAGTVLTALSVALVNGENILQSKTLLTCTLVCSLLPDIDFPQAPISRITGNKFHGFSSYLMRRFGHRTITHSVFALCVVALVAWTLAAFGTGVSVKVCVYAYFYHLVCDMMTVEGVPFLYPIARKWVLPGNRRFRFSTGNTSTSIVILGVSCLMGVFCLPLIERGWWTTYNESFASQRSLHSEFVKSKDMLSVQYNYKIGNEEKTGVGLVVESQEARTILYENNRFHVIADGVNGTVVKEMRFVHTSRTFAIETLNFVTISTDSLNSIVQRSPIVSLDIVCSGRAKVQESGVRSDFATLKREWANGLIFYSNDSAFAPRPFVFVPSALAKLKRNEIATLRAEHNLRLQQYENRQIELQNLIAEDTKDAAKREENMRRIARIRGEQPPTLDEIRIRQIEFEAQTADAQEALSVEMRRNEHERSERERAQARGVSAFSGTIKILKIVN